MFDERRMAYGACMLLALAVFIVVRRLIPRSAAYRQLAWTRRCALGLAAFIGGVFGARLPFALSADGGIFSTVAWAGDGKTILTGLAGAYLAVELAKWLLGVPVKTGDTWAVPLAAALCVGRWGCYFNGCCHGIATGAAWGVNFGDGVLRHPTQIYESLFHAGMLVVLLGLILKRPRSAPAPEPWPTPRGSVGRVFPEDPQENPAVPRRAGVEHMTDSELGHDPRLPAAPRWAGHHLKFYLIAYAGFRFAIEFIRPEPAWLTGLTFYQWTAAAMALALAAQWAWDAHAAERSRALAA